MSKNVKVLIIVGVCLSIVGALLCALSFSMGFHHGFAVTLRGKYVNLGESIEECSFSKTAIGEFTDMDVKSIRGDIKFIASDGYYIEYTGTSMCEYSLGNDGILHVSMNLEDDAREQRYLIYLGSHHDVLTIYYPSVQSLGSVKISADYGDIDIGGLSCSSLEITSGMGDTSLSEVSASNIAISADCGDLSCNEISGDNMSVSISAGDAKFYKLTLNNELAIVSDFGDVKLDGISAEVISIDEDCGDISLKRYFAGSRIDLANDFGDIELGYPRDGLDSYNYYLKTDLGDVEYDRRDMGRKYTVDNGALKTVTVENNCGDIDVEL